MTDRSDLDILGWHPDGTAVAYVKTEEDRQILGYITLDPIHQQPLQDTVIVEIDNTRVAGHQLFWSETNIIYYVDLNPATSATRLMAIDIKTTQQQVILEANMLVNKLRRDGLSTDDIADEIMKFPKYVIPHINDTDVQA